MLLSCVALDLAVLAFYKVRGALPLGISFYTFQAISYVADTYKNPADGTKNLREALQYLTFFPQLAAGPFLKFSALRPYLDRRDVSWEKNAQGVRRFVCGLCKKVLLSTAAAKLADAMFSLASIDALGAWTGALGYCLQLYFDFSGYSDMALGLGLLFGVPPAGKFPASLLRRLGNGVLAALAHDALWLVPGLCLYSPRRQPEGARADGFQ